jgi:hypothetical protein
MPRGEYRDDVIRGVLQTYADAITLAQPDRKKTDGCTAHQCCQFAVSDRALALDEGGRVLPGLTKVKNWSDDVHQDLDAGFRPVA